MIKEAIAKLIDKKDLAEDEMAGVFNEIMTGGTTDAQIGAFLIALRIKGETIEEIAGAAKVMREKALKIKTPDGAAVIDTCGTGGDSSGTFNISTTAAFIAAGAGLTVAKHGNRSVSSRAGSADVLKALGVNIEAGQEKVEECLEKCRIGFLFAPLMHGAMKYAIGPRREIGARTVFNVLGPLCNPAGAQNQLIGVYDSSLTEPLANVLKKLGSKHVMVVHGNDGLDEITLSDTTQVSELKDGKVTTYTLDPRDYGFSFCPPEELKGGESEDNAVFTLGILNGSDKGPKRDTAVINAAAAIVTGGLADDMKEGIEAAQKSIDQGEALKRLEELKALC